MSEHTTLKVTGVLLVAGAAIGLNLVGFGTHHVDRASVGYIQGSAVSEDLQQPHGIDAVRCQTLFDEGVRTGVIGQSLIAGTQELDWLDGCEGRTS
jgi:hypothetical protein